ncbi:MAG: succinyl-CoA--3-ketoacid-CoA transferase, partial [Sphingobacteriales bacterium]
LPLTGMHCVKRIFTELAVLDVLPEGGFKLVEIAHGHTLDDIRAATAGKLITDGIIKKIEW